MIKTFYFQRFTLRSGVLSSDSNLVCSRCCAGFARGNKQNWRVENYGQEHRHSCRIHIQQGQHLPAYARSRLKEKVDSRTTPISIWNSHHCNENAHESRSCKHDFEGKTLWTTDFLIIKIMQGHWRAKHSALICWLWICVRRGSGLWTRTGN